MDISDEDKERLARQLQLNGFVAGGLFTPMTDSTDMDTGMEEEALVHSGPGRAIDTVNVPVPLRILFIDIGQGNATLVIGPGNESILIDCGSVTEDAIADELVINATKAINGYLEKENHLDYLIISHPDKDHVNKVEKVLRGFSIGKVLCGGRNVSNYSGSGKGDLAGFLKEIDIKLVDCLINEGALYSEAPNLPADQRLVQTRTPGFDVFIVCANAPVASGSTISTFLELNSAKPGTEANCSSVVVCIRYKDPTYDGGTYDQVLVCADATFSTEYQILAKSGWAGHLQSFLLSGGHHGSADSFSPRFLREVNASFVHFSANMHGRFRHPTWEVVQRILTHCPNVKTTTCELHEIVIGCTMADKPSSHSSNLMEAPTLIMSLLETMDKDKKNGATVLAEYVKSHTVTPFSPVWLQDVSVEIVEYVAHGRNPRIIFRNQLPSTYHGKVLDTMLEEQRLRAGLTFTDARDSVVYWDSNPTHFGLISSLLGANTGVHWELSLHGDGHTAPDITKY
ncbi:ComEC/Rec2 family competence protein [Pseudomonas bharatica]|uniref:ComEC/Rec2 family competence protein n=1 Tax=Pseudomonas TaxID=286 RepID=UPI003B2821C7